MAKMLDPLQGLNPDQSGPKEKIQNGDPKAAPNVDQRSGTVESGGPKPSLQKGPTGTKEGMVELPEGQVKVETESDLNRANIPGLNGETLPAGTHDRAGDGQIEDGKLKDHTD